MSIQEIIQSGANISITVGTNDLLQFANHLIHSTKEELENTILAKKQEKYLTPDEAKVQLHEFCIPNSFPIAKGTVWLCIGEFQAVGEYHKVSPHT